MRKWFFKGLIFVGTVQLVASDVRRDSGVDSEDHRRQSILGERKRSSSGAVEDTVARKLDDEQKYEALRREHEQLRKQHEKQQEKNNVLEALVSALKAQAEQLRMSLDTTRILLEAERTPDVFFTEGMTRVPHFPASDLDDGMVPVGEESD